MYMSHYDKTPYTPVRSARKMFLCAYAPGKVDPRKIEFGGGSTSEKVDLPPPITRSLTLHSQKNRLEEGGQLLTHHTHLSHPPTGDIYNVEPSICRRTLTFILPVVSLDLSCCDLRIAVVLHSQGSVVVHTSAARETQRVKVVLKNSVTRDRGRRELSKFCRAFCLTSNRG